MITARDLNEGVRYFDPRYGVLTVMCDRGMCSHEKRDRYSVHVRCGSMEFFNAYYDDETFRQVD